MFHFGSLKSSYNVNLQRITVICEQFLQVLRVGYNQTRLYTYSKILLMCYCDTRETADTRNITIREISQAKNLVNIFQHQNSYK